MRVNKLQKKKKNIGGQNIQSKVVKDFVRLCGS